jgi:hypothetical protein
MADSLSHFKTIVKIKGTVSTQGRGFPHSAGQRSATTVSYIVGTYKSGTHLATISVSEGLNNTAAANGKGRTGVRIPASLPSVKASDAGTHCLGVHINLSMRGQTSLS